MKKRILAISISVFMLVICLYVNSFYPSSLSVEDLEASDLFLGTQVFEPDSTFASVEIEFPSNFISVDLSTEPKKIFAGQGFTLAANFHAEARLNSDTVIDTITWSLDPVNRHLEDAMVSLDLASATIEPEGSQSIGADRSVSWSLHFDSSREHVGLLKIMSDEFEEGQMSGQISFELARHRDFWNWVTLFGIIISALAASVTIVEFSFRVWPRMSKNSST